MNIVDWIILIFCIGALYRGHQIGFVRQFFSTAGFFIGLLIGALLQPHTVTFAHSEVSKALVTLITTLGSALLVMTAGEYLGITLKRRVQIGKLNRTDDSLGSLLSVITLLLVVWLGANISQSLPGGGLQVAIDNSRIVSALSDHLPPAPGVIAGLGKLIDPNGFPQVFTGKEPTPTHSNVTPSLVGFSDAIDADAASVVKIEGQGCGGIVEGSGFVVGDGLIATNAHVVAGIDRPYVIDANGTHRANAIWFDPDLDLAVLRTTDLAGQPLTFNIDSQANETRTAVLGYPGGGPFSVESGVILDQFIATGRNIYGQGATARNVYEVRAGIIPGNSGGPMITADGKVVGVVFAQSTSYQGVGYTLTASKVSGEINAAKARGQTVSTASCAE